MKEEGTRDRTDRLYPELIKHAMDRWTDAQSDGEGSQPQPFLREMPHTCVYTHARAHTHTHPMGQRVRAKAHKHTDSSSWTKIHRLHPSSTPSLPSPGTGILTSLSLPQSSKSVLPSPSTSLIISFAPLNSGGQYGCPGNSHPFLPSGIHWWFD